MKNYLKYILIILVVLAMTLGIDVRAEDYLESRGGEIAIELPIHKTDINKKGLEGAKFTLKDFNNTISSESKDKKDGDYLIEIYEYSEGTAPSREDIDYRIVDYTSKDKVLTKILDIIPTKYSDVFRKAENADDFFEMLDLPLVIFNNEGQYFNVGFYIPLKVEESKVPTGYKAKNIIIPAFVRLSYNYGTLYARLSYTPGYWNYERFEMIPAYYEYKDGTDYEKIFDSLNDKLSDVNSDEDLLELFEKNGAVIDNDCDINEPLGREDLEARFAPKIEESLCPINLVDEKEEIPIVNPETAGTLGIVALLIVIGFVTTIATKKIRNKKDI